MERSGRDRRGDPWNGWPLVGWATIGVALMLGVVLATQGRGEDGWRMAIRATARSSATLFLLAFAASSLRRIWRNDLTAWLLRNRRQIGVSFGVSHLFHAFAILAVAVQSASFRAGIDGVTLVGGGIGYVFLAAMTATSFDRSTAWLGRRRWKQLHTIGSWYLWGVFLVTFLGRVPESAISTAALIALTGVGALRVALRLRERRSAHAV